MGQCQGHRRSARLGRDALAFIPREVRPAGSGCEHGGTMFEVACKLCAMRLAVDRIHDAEATALAGHLRERHPELGVSALGNVFEHYRVMPTCE